MAVALVELIDKSRKQLSQMVGLALGSTVSVRKEDGQWRLRIEVVERKSLPDSQDLLATYDLAVDDEGRILDFSRIGMRRRMDPVTAGAGEE